jgi:hypothetical protein
MTHGLEVLIATDKADAARYIHAHPGLDDVKVSILDKPREGGARFDGVHVTDAAKAHPGFLERYRLLAHEAAEGDRVFALEDRIAVVTATYSHDGQLMSVEVLRHNEVDYVTRPKHLPGHGDVPALGVEL